MGLLRVVDAKPTGDSQATVIPRKLTTRTITLKDLGAEIEAHEVKALAQRPSDVLIEVEQIIAWGNRRRPSGTWVIPCATMASDVQPVMSTPCRATRPAVGRTIPQMALSSVDLPAPFEPTSVTISPAATETLTSLKI